MTSQVNTLIDTVGDQGNDIAVSFGLTEKDKKKCDAVKKKFQGRNSM